MDLFQALLLGLLQGFTEILPISSSAHLIIVPRLFGWPESGLTFDVALHLGTFIALMAYFRRDVAAFVLNACAAIKSRSMDTPEKRLPFYIVAATFPAAIIGKLFEERIEDIFRSNILLIALFLVVFGLLLGVCEKYGSQADDISRMTFGKGMLVGIFQCLALIPGVSRSGITITAAMLAGFTRESAARFSFLLSLPIVAGAAMLKLLHLFKAGIPAGEGMPLLIGVSASAAAGYASVAFLLKFVQSRSLAPFVWYRLLFGGVLLWSVFSGHIR